MYITIVSSLSFNLLLHMILKIIVLCGPKSEQWSESYLRATALVTASFIRCSLQLSNLTTLLTLVRYTINQHV